MTRMRIVGLALVAAFAISAIAAASASAATVGLFAQGGGSAVGTTFTSKSETGTKPTLQGVAVGTKVVCEEETNKGTILSPTADSSIVTFTGCTDAGVGCNSSGQAAGVIVSTVSSKLGIINFSKSEYGVLISPSPATKFECGAANKIEVKGSFILTILSLGGGAVALEKPFLTWDVTGVQTKGVQATLAFEGGGNELLESATNGGAFEMAGEAINVLETYSKTVELGS